MHPLIELCANEVPTNWLDPLLTGKEAVISGPPFGCVDIQCLLNAIKERIRAIPESEIAAVMGKAGEAVAWMVRSDRNGGYSQPFKSISEAETDAYNEKIAGATVSDIKPLFYAAPAALPKKEEATLVSYAPDGSSCELDINGVSFYYENGKACDCEDCKRNTAALPEGYVRVKGETIQHLLEYWNGNKNERAMVNALDHILSELEFILAAAQGAEE